MKNQSSKVYRLLKSPNGAELLFLNSPDDSIYEVIEFFVDENSPLRVQACAFLCRAVKKKRYFDIINTQISRNVLYRALKSDNNKLRKNSIILLGRIITHDKEKIVSDVQNLAEALENETVLMVVPSIILALGVSKNEAAYRAIDEYSIPLNAIKKHENEINNAIRKAKENYSENAMHEFVGLGKPYSFELRVAQNLSLVLNTELIDNLFFTKEHTDSAVIVTTDDYERLFTVRSFREILLPIGENIELSAEKIANCFVSLGIPFVIDAHTMTKHDEFSPFRYRIELRADKKLRRNEFITQIVNEIQRLNSKSVVNSVSGYEVELRIEQTDADKCNAFIKLFTVPDKRFDYRVGTIPASITPANAAALVRSGKMKHNSRVLDFCCGSGTLLVERSKVFEFPIKEVVGVDISSEAISIAKKNLIAANVVNFSLLNCDCRNYYPKE
ncbi:MAG: methyltransferase domain-containing protein, partial [Clostridiales bacterium]|nr:methyltransferase domain-containing protein [Clostridiales bacterium]